MFTKSPDHNDAFAEIFSVDKKVKGLLGIRMEKKHAMLTLSFISILSISPPIKSTMFSPCFNRNASSSSIVWKDFTSWKDNKFE